VDENGEMVGIVSLSEALRRAENVGLDLIEISPQAEPPVCKLLDNGKYKYELQKKKNEAKKNQKIIEIKEIKLRPMIGDHDYEIKLKQMKKFLSEGDKVKVTLRYRGREMAHKELGFKVFERVTRDVEGFGTPDNQPAFEGRQVLMMVSPVK
jgi:translation initiation factor IF-3